MANEDRPSGAKPVSTLSGSSWAGHVREYSVDASNATAIFRGDFVALEADGNITPATAGTTNPILGVVVGIVVDKGVAATEHPGYLPASTAGTVKVCVGPDIIYEIQSDDVSATLDAASVGANVAFIAGAGSTTTGNSAHEIDADTLTVAGSEQLRILDTVNREDNEVGAVNQKFLVIIHESHFKSTNGI